MQKPQGDVLSQVGSGIVDIVNIDYNTVLYYNTIQYYNTTVFHT